MVRPPPPYIPEMRQPSRLSALEGLWTTRSLAWLILVGEGLALVLALSNPAPGLVVRFGLYSLTIQWIALLALLALYLARDRLSRLAAPAIANIAIACLLGSAATVLFLMFAMTGALWPESNGDEIHPGLRYAGITAVVIALGTAAFHNHWKARRSALRTKQAELEALQARIRPHFLFNTLNTAAALVHSRPDLAETVLLDLSDLFRAALAGPQDIPLSAEIALTQRYLEIESLRFGERLRVSWDLPESLPAIFVPALSIQPLVENAVKHSVERVERGCLIQISASVTRDHVLVTIRNPLVLGSTQHSSHQVGLSAAQARVEALTAGRGSVETSVQGEHFVATMRLPRTPSSRRQ